MSFKKRYKLNNKTTSFLQPYTYIQILKNIQFENSYYVKIRKVVRNFIKYTKTNKVKKVQV